MVEFSCLETLIKEKIKGKRTGLLKDLCGTLNSLRNNTSKNCKNIVESWTRKKSSVESQMSVFIPTT